MKPKFKRRLIQVDGRLVQNGGSVSDVARNAQIFAERQANN